MALLVKEDWQVQGRKGSKPLKVKKQSRTPSPPDNQKARHNPQEKPVWVVENCLKGKKRVGTDNFKSVKIKECLKEPSRTNNQGAKPRAGEAKAKKRSRKTRFTKDPEGYPQVRNGRYTLDWWKCYLDSCASYHTFFVKEFLRDISKGTSTMSGSCNADTVLLKRKG